MKDRNPARRETALVLVSLSPQAEAQRKSFGTRRQTHAVFSALMARCNRLGRSLTQVDFLLCAPDTEIFGEPVSLPQRGGDLGAILRNASNDAFALGYDRVLLIGNDAPGLTPTYLRAAIRALESNGSVAILGPAHDGGYALLGMNGPCDSAFEGVHWGSDQVADQTQQRLELGGFVVERLATVRDLDDRQSLRWFLTTARGTRWAAWLEPIRPILDALFHVWPPLSVRRRTTEPLTSSLLRAPPIG